MTEREGPNQETAEFEELNSLSADSVQQIPYDSDSSNFLANLIAGLNQAKEKLASTLDPQVFSAYIEPLELVSDSIKKSDFGALCIELAAPSKLVIAHVERLFLSSIRDALSDFLKNPDISCTLVVLGQSKIESQSTTNASQYVVKRVRSTPAVIEDSAAPPQALPQADEPSGLNSKYTFSEFVVGNSNQFCHAAAMRVAERPGHSYNPLFIYGGVGLGKTHLLHAIGNAVLERDSSSRILYISSETFTNDLINALRNAKMEEFKRRLRAIEVLLIDDIQFIVGKERTQEEFFHTFNSLYGAKRQIVITSDKIPTEIPGIEERLQTRFSWGLTADLQAPDFETRVAIARQKAFNDLFELPEDVAHFVAEHIHSNVRELEGALNRLQAISSIKKIPISLEMCKEALRPLLQPKNVILKIPDIQRAVSLKFGIKVSEMVSKRRTKNLSFPRHIAMYLCRKHTTASYPEIGELFGGRDHSSVIHAATVVSTKLSTDKAVKNMIEELENQLLNK